MTAFETQEETQGTETTPTQDKRRNRRQVAATQSPRKAPIPVLRGLASGDIRKTRLSGATMALIEAKTAAHDATPSDAIFIAAVTAMTRRKHQLPKVAQVAEIDLQLPPAVWEFLDTQVRTTKSDLETVIQTYLGLV